MLSNMQDFSYIARPRSEPGLEQPNNLTIEYPLYLTLRPAEGQF